MHKGRYFWQRGPAPLRWFLLVMTGLFGLAFLFPPAPTRLDLTTPRARTTSDKRLYFQNVRSYYYRRDTRSKAPMEIYRLKDVPPQWPALALRPRLVLHPVQQRAFVSWVPGKACKQRDTIIVSFPNAQQRFIWHPQLTWRQQFGLAGRVYGALKQNQKIAFQSKIDTLDPVAPGQASRQALEVILKDYFNLLAKPINHE